MKLFKLLAVGFAVILSTRAATILYDNTADASNGNRLVSPTEYESFSTGGTAFTLQDLKFVLAGNPDANSFSVNVYSDNSSTPGSLFAAVATEPDSVLVANSFVTVDVSGLSIALSASTRYWIGLSTSNGSDAIWSLAVPTGGDTGLAGQFYFDGTVHTTELEAFQMQVNGAPTTGGVPEPATFLLGGTGLITLFLFRCRGQRQ